MAEKSSTSAERTIATPEASIAELTEMINKQSAQIAEQARKVMAQEERYAFQQTMLQRLESENTALKEQVAAYVSQPQTTSRQPQPLDLPLPNPQRPWGLPPGYTPSITQTPGNGTSAVRQSDIPVVVGSNVGHEGPTVGQEPRDTTGRRNLEGLFDATTQQVDETRQGPDIRTKAYDTDAERAPPVWLKKLQELEAIVERIPGIPAPIKKSQPESFADSPFADEIALIDMPKKFSLPNLRLYDGTTDPDEHMAHYRQRMHTVAIPRELREACMCKGFGSSLSGPAMEWFTSLPSQTITSFADLNDAFVQQFSSSRKLRKQPNDLYKVTQRRGESLRDYLGRFNREKVHIPTCDVTTAVSAFRKGLLPDSDLYKELTKYTCNTMEDVLARAWAQIKWEEDEVNDRRHRSTHEEHSDRHSRNLRRSSRGSRPEPYPSSTSERRNTGRPSGAHDRTRPPRLEDHNFCVTTGELVQALAELGEGVKWPPKTNRPADQRDKTKWCEFHKDHGHRTMDCIALRLEVAEQLKRGRLTHLLRRDDKDRKDPARTSLAPEEPPRNPRTVNCITGGSDISGYTYSAAKRHTRALSNTRASSSSDTSVGPELITFSAEDIARVDYPHDDALVVSVFLGNFDIKRVLVDSGSSVNIIYMSAVKEMGAESQILRAPSVLVFGNGAPDRTVGEITLLTLAAGLNVPVKYQVMDCPSAYNALLGRPWIHQMKAVPSTLHQVIKFYTPWGIRQIEGNQRASRECYQASLKAPKNAAA